MLPSSSQVRRVLQEPGSRGVQIGMGWKVIEPAPNKLDFSWIDQYLAVVDDFPNRYLVIQFMDRCFGHCRPTATFPSDMIPTMIEERKSRDHREQSWVAKLWEPEVMDREIRVISALGERYNRHPRFEGIVIPETAGTGAPAAQQVAQLRRLLIAAKAAFPNTNVWLNMNWLPPNHEENLRGLLNSVIPLRVGVGWPDTYSPECTPRVPFLHGVLPDYPENQFPKFASMQSGPLSRCLKQLKSARPADVVEWLYTYAVKTAKAHHISWVVKGHNAPYDYWAQAVPYLNAHPTTFEACPSNIAPCSMSK
jgi:hypothetical protein